MSKQYMCIKTYDKRVNDLEIGNTYIIDYDEKSYYPYHLRNFPFLLTDDEIKEYFITIEEWREKRINKILENV